MGLNLLEEIVASSHSYSCVSGYEQNREDAIVAFNAELRSHFKGEKEVLDFVRDAMFSFWDGENADELERYSEPDKSASAKGLWLCRGRKHLLQEISLKTLFDAFLLLVPPA